MIREYCYPVETDKNLSECEDIMNRFKLTGEPILFKVKGTNFYICLVQEVKKDMIRIKRNYYTYNSLIESLKTISIEGVVDLVANYTVDGASTNDEVNKIGIVPLIVKMRSKSDSRFIADTFENIFLLTKTKILDDNYISIQVL